MASERSSSGGRRPSALLDAELPTRIRAERERRSVSLRELARRLNVSPSAISQIETGRARPSVATLYAIVSELGMSLDELFAPEPDRLAREAVDAVRVEAAAGGAASTLTVPASVSPTSPLVQRAGDRRFIDLETGVRWERLTPLPDRVVDFLFVRYDVGGASSPTDRLIRHSGREYGIVLRGILEVTVGFETSRVGPGDAISFDSTLPHRLANRGPEPVEAVWLVIGRHSPDASSASLPPAADGDGTQFDGT